MGDSSARTNKSTETIMAKEKEKVVPTTRKKEPEGNTMEPVMRELSQLRLENASLKSNLQKAASQIEFLVQGEMHKKLDWLWKVITLDGAVDVFGVEFFKTCVEEFKGIMTPPEPEHLPEE